MLSITKEMIGSLVNDPDVRMTREEFEASISLANDDDDLNAVLSKYSSDIPDVLEDLKKLSNFTMD